jgi:hypothetical protein
MIIILHCAWYSTYPSPAFTVPLSGGQMFTTYMDQRNQQIEGVTRPQILRFGCWGIDIFDWYISAWKKYHKTACTSLPGDEQMDLIFAWPGIINTNNEGNQLDATVTKSTKRRLYRTIVATGYNKICTDKQLWPNYVSIKINGNNQQYTSAVRAATQYRLNQEIKFFYIKKNKLNEEFDTKES